MTDPAVAARAAHYALTRSAQTLIGICSGLVADGRLNDQEVSYLRTWLAEHADVAAIWPGSVIAARIERHRPGERRLRRVPCTDGLCVKR